jgi:hypothetical protein
MLDNCPYVGKIFPNMLLVLLDFAHIIVGMPEEVNCCRIVQKLKACHSKY